MILFKILSEHGFEYVKIKTLSKLETLLLAVQNNCFIFGWTMANLDYMLLHVFFFGFPLDEWYSHLGLTNRDSCCIRLIKKITFYPKNFIFMAQTRNILLRMGMLLHLILWDALCLKSRCALFSHRKYLTKLWTKLFDHLWMKVPSNAIILCPNSDAKRLMAKNVLKSKILVTSFKEDKN